MQSFIKLPLIILSLAAMIGTTAMAKSSHSGRGAWLGVVTQSVDYDLAETLDLDVKYGVIINELVEDSPAEEVGLKIDDVIIACDGHKITDSEDLVDLLEEHQVGDQVTIGLIRDGKRTEIPVVLAKRPRGRFASWDNGSNYRFRIGNGTHSSDSYIGVQVIDLSRQLGDFFGVEKGRGALIREVEEDSPAKAAGLKAGDVIVAVGAEKVRDAGDVVEYISDTEPGDHVNVTVIRDKAEVTLEVEVDESYSGSGYGGLFDGVYRPGTDAVVGLNLGDLDIQIPNLGGTYRCNQGAPLDVASDDLTREMDQLRKELKEMQQDLRREFKTELDRIQELIEN